MSEDGFFVKVPERSKLGLETQDCCFPFTAAVTLNNVLAYVRRLDFVCFINAHDYNIFSGSQVILYIDKIVSMWLLHLVFTEAMVIVYIYANDKVT